MAHPLYPLSPYGSLSISELKERKESTFRKFCRDHRTYVFGFIKEHVKDPGIVRQVLDDTFVNAWLYIDEYDEKKMDVSTWLFVVACATMMKIAREQKSSKMLLQLIGSLPKAYQQPVFNVV